MTSEPIITPAPSASDLPLIEMRGIEKSFASNHVLRGVDFALHRGEIVTMLGGSGSGKSVILKHLVGLLRADAGQLRVEGRDVTRLGERDWVEFRKRIAYIFQGGALFDSLSVFENVAYGLREHLALDEGALGERVARCLAAVGLGGVEDQMPAALSGGMRKRVAVARGIALEPGIILYDEPTTGLDPANSKRIGQLITSLRDRLGVTSLIVTHDLDLCFRISDRVVLLGQGRILASGIAAEIRGSTQPEVREFLSGHLGVAQDPWHEDPSRVESGSRGQEPGTASIAASKE